MNALLSNIVDKTERTGTLVLAHGLRRPQIHIPGKGRVQNRIFSVEPYCARIRVWLRAFCMPGGQQKEVRDGDQSQFDINKAPCNYSWHSLS